MEQRYTTLHTIGLVLKVLAVIVILLTLLLAGFTVMGAAMSGNAMSGGSMGYDLGRVATFAGMLTLIPILLGGLGSSLSLYVSGEVLCLLVDLEQNTRSTAVLLERLIKRQRGSGS